MTASTNLPEGVTNIPFFLRRMKFVFQPLQYLKDFAQAYGDCFTVWGRDGTPIIYFSQPQALEAIFTADPSHFEAGRGNRGLKFLLGENSLVLLDGDRHLRQRQLLAPPFHGDRMRTYGNSIREIAYEVSDKWQVDKPFNIRESMQEISLRVILRVVFGLDAPKDLEQLRQLISSLLEFMGSPLMSLSFFFPFLRTDYGAWSPWGKVVRLQQRIDELVYALIKQRRTESGQNRQDILSLMISARDADGEGMTDAELHDELMTLLIAGHETTASALIWSFYWVDRLPKVRDRLMEELQSANNNPTTIAKLPYLTAVCQETLRIHPIIASAFPRIVKSPMEITGYTIPPGSVIIPTIYLAHHREEVYPQPHAFKPERFLERQFSPYEFLPFGGGNRRCIGMAFAQYEMKLVLATILSRFQLSMVNKRPVKPVRRGLTMAAPAGMKMVAKVT